MTSFRNSGQQLSHLGYFVGFMQAFGRASQPTRDQVFTDTQDYGKGRITADAEVRDVSQLLGLAIPPGW